MERLTLMTDKTAINYSEMLRALEIEHTRLEHPSLVTPEEVQGYLGEPVSDCIASLFMKADDTFIVILKKGEDRLDLKKLKKYLKLKDLRFASKEEFEKQTSLPFRAARVYIPGFATYIDPRVLEVEYLNGGTGCFTSTFKYKTSDLTKIPGSVIFDFSE